MINSSVIIQCGITEISGILRQLFDCEGFTPPGSHNAEVTTGME